MTKHNKARDLARKLYLEGQSTDLIAQQCETSRRTVQRWIKDFDKEPIIIKTKGEASSTEALQENYDAEMSSDDVEVSANVASNVAEILPQLEKVANLKNGDELDFHVSTRMALHLINLTEKSLATLDACLTDPDVRTVDRLKAVELVCQLSGLKDGKVLQQVLNKFDLTYENIDLKTATTSLVPKKLAEAKKVHKQVTEEYTNELYREFVEDDFYFPVTFEEEYFDIELFLQLLKYQDMQHDSQGYDFEKKGITILGERGFQEKLRELGHDV